MFNLLLITMATILGVYSSKNMNKINMIERTGKVFSLFSVVQFPNDGCTSSSTVFPKGTCFAASECSAKSGTAYGNCAAGFGVCCVFTSSTCGSTINQNCTYITNPGFPSTYTTTGTCEWTVNKCSSDICQLRLDFISLALNTATGPTDALTCLGCCGSGCTTDCAAIGIATATDSLTVTGQTGVNPPVICGINTGYHMYLETGTSATDTGLISFYMAQTGNRQWKVKVSQISCRSDWRVPSQCVQYFTGVAGDVQSYGFGSGQLLTRQKYDNCIRQEQGYCQMVWSESATTSPDPFQLPGATAAIHLSQNSACIEAYVFIQGGDMGTGLNTGTGNTWCGEHLFCEGAAILCIAPFIPTPITSSSFYLGVFSDSNIKDISQTPETASTGFNLKYYQVPC